MPGECTREVTLDPGDLRTLRPETTGQGEPARTGRGPSPAWCEWPPDRRPRNDRVTRSLTLVCNWFWVITYVLTASAGVLLWSLVRPHSKLSSNRMVIPNVFIIVTATLASG